MVKLGAVNNNQKEVNPDPEPRVRAASVSETVQTPDEEIEAEEVAEAKEPVAGDPTQATPDICEAKTSGRHAKCRGIFHSNAIPHCCCHPGCEAMCHRNPLCSGIAYKATGWKCAVHSVRILCDHCGCVLRPKARPRQCAEPGCEAVVHTSRICSGINDGCHKDRP